MKRFLRLSTTVRLTVLYTAITVVVVASILALAFLALYRTLQQDDLLDARGRILGYWAQYQTSDLTTLIEDIGVANVLTGDRPYFVRIANTANDTVYLSYPQAWEPFRMERLSLAELDPDIVHVLSSPRHDYVLEVSGAWLDDDYFLQLGLSSDVRSRLLSLFRRNVSLIALGVILLGSAAGLVIATRALRPIAQVTSVAETIIATGKLDSRVEEGTGGAELDQLVAVLNRMFARIERLVDGMRSTVDMVAHDLRTPITRLRARAELAIRSGSPEDAAEALGETVEQADELLRLVNTLLEITEAEGGVMHLTPSRFNVATLIAEVFALYDLAAEDRQIDLAYDGPSELDLCGDRVRIRQVVANLVDNAVKYCRRGGTVTVVGAPGGAPAVGADAGAAGAGGGVTLSVTDTGPGIPPGELERVWDRMYRGPVQPSDTGFGLGLSLVRAVVTAHGGEVSAQSEPGTGATFTVAIPDIQEET